MSLLDLRGIGKIYVSENNVAVGIRGVDLSFERGEFVAVTGKSGSGKSTLLNVISGMDSYEEGELCVNGEPTSHYLQPDWEEYREKYVSFIFQDYNIIDSFTVLQNVELSLMHITDPRARRARAMELISRVGLSSHAKHKGSRLSGGQKQRTVIARALAKDSPIILADEPTGNLDYATSKEIIELLHEVSEDKLVIVVTHNFDQLESCATRHIRIFDGAVESDRIIKAAPAPAECADRVHYEGAEGDRSVGGDGTNGKSGGDCEDGRGCKDGRVGEIGGDGTDCRVGEIGGNVRDGKRRKKEEFKKQLRDGAILGRTIFLAKPKLSVFLCFLMILGTLGTFMAAAVCGDAFEIFNKKYMFNHIDGRVVIAGLDGSAISEDEVSALASKHGAESYLRFDALLDEKQDMTAVIFPVDDENFTHRYGYPSVSYVYGKDYGESITGRYPEGADEVFLYLPITYRPVLGQGTLKTDRVIVSGAEYKLVGVKYYYDNNIVPECLFSEKGFKTATAMRYIVTRANASVRVSVTDAELGETKQLDFFTVVPSFDMPEDKIFISSREYDGVVSAIGGRGGKCSVSATLNSIYYTYDYYYGNTGTSVHFEHDFNGEDITSERPVVSELYAQHFTTQNCVFVSDELLLDIAQTVLDLSYRQASLFFEDDAAARDASERIREEGYLAVPSYTEYEPGVLETVAEILAFVLLGGVFALAIVFFAFFINLCSSRALDAFKGDMAIMRSMGIGVKVIRAAMYVRMLISIAPALLLLAVTATVIYTSPATNSYFTFLYAHHYALILVGIVALVLRITHKQISRLFGESVRAALRGGADE